MGISNLLEDLENLQGTGLLSIMKRFLLSSLRGGFFSDGILLVDVDDKLELFIGKNR